MEGGRIGLNHEVQLLGADVMALLGCQGFRDSVKRSRLGCYAGSSVWGRVKGVPGVEVAEVWVSGGLRSLGLVSGFKARLW